MLLLALGVVACGHGVLYQPWSAANPPGGSQDAADARGTGLSPGGAEPPLQLRWQQQIGKPPLGGPLVVGPLLLQWSKAPDLLAFDVASGTRLGKYASDDPVCGPSAIAGVDHHLLLASVLGKPSQLRAIDLRSAEVTWQQDGSLCAAVVVRGDTVYAAFESGKMQAFDAAQGQPLWTLALTAPLISAPSLAGDRLYVADGTGELVAAGIDSGHVLWRRSLGTPLRTRPAVDVAGGRVLAAVDGRLHALSAASGAELWHADFSGLPSVGLYVSDHVVAVGSTDHRLYAFDTGGIVQAAPVGTEHTIYFGASDSWLHAVDVSDGSSRWRQQLDGPVLVGATLTAQTLAVTTERGTTYVFGKP